MPPSPPDARARFEAVVTSLAAKRDALRARGDDIVAQTLDGILARLDAERAAVVARPDRSGDDAAYEDMIDRAAAIGQYADLALSRRG
ncbi:MAG: hypothetical protein H6708_16610 [Kofleriaceae bacterium]|nr:hypothetical protein [Kofleriaceae bacterium]